MEMSIGRSVGVHRRAVSAVLAVLAGVALFTSVLVAPAGAQSPPTASADVKCFPEGTSVIVVTFAEPTVG